jgi:hypothetical protein
VAIPLDEPELWRAVAGAAVAGGSLLVLHRPGSGATVLAGLVIAAALDGPGAAMVLACVAVPGALLSWRRSAPRPWTPTALSVVAAGALYACVPDTERALALLGAMTVAAAAAIVGRWSWDATATTLSVGAVVVVITDGEPRTSAVVGGVAIAVIHELAQWARPAKAGVAAACMAMAVCSRVAGRGDDTLRPAVVAAAAFILTAAVLAWEHRARRHDTTPR